MWYFQGVKTYSDPSYNNSFEWKNDILRGWKHTLTLSTYFQGVRTSPPQDLHHWWATRAVDDQLWEGQRVSSDLGLSTTGHLHPRFGVFVLSHDNLSPVKQQRHWLEDTACSWSDKDGSIVNISKINEVIMSNCSSLMWRYSDTCSYTTSFEWKNETFSGRGQNILTPPTYFQRVRTRPKDFTPGLHLSHGLSQCVTTKMNAKLPTVMHCFPEALSYSKMAPHWPQELPLIIQSVSNDNGPKFTGLQSRRLLGFHRVSPSN